MEDKVAQDVEKKEKEITVDDKIVQIVLDEHASISLEDFRSNDKKILSLLNQENDLVDNQYTFNGLARKLGMHQQSLSRSLHRLESAGLVEKTNYGYKLSRNLNSILVKKSRLDLENLSKKIPRQHLQFIQILQMYIPNSVSVEQIIEKLAGKWFGNLRWIGLLEGEGSYILQWTYDERFQVNLKITSRYAIVESNSTNDGDNVEATISAYKIFEQITKIFQKNQSEKNNTNNLNSFSQYN